MHSTKPSPECLLIHDVDLVPQCDPKGCAAVAQALCINPAVTALSTASRINEACADLQQAKAAPKKKAAEAEVTDGKPKVTNENPSCRRMVSVYQKSGSRPAQLMRYFDHFLRPVCPNRHAGHYFLLQQPQTAHASVYNDARDC